jgi:hypothetical protein
MLFEECAAPRKICGVKQRETLTRNRRGQPPSVPKILDKLRRSKQRRSIVWPKEPRRYFADAAFHRHVYFLRLGEKEKHESDDFRKNLTAWAQASCHAEAGDGECWLHDFGYI